MRLGFNLKVSLLLLLAGTLGLTGCSLGGGVTAAPQVSAPTFPLVGSPTIASPASNPFYSSDNSVSIVGQCTTGDRVLLFGAGSGETACVDSTYSFVISKNSDGLYSFLITQINPLRGTSSPASFIWIRKTSVAPPIVTSPASNPFASTQSQLVINGNCETSATVTLGRDGVGSVLCSNSSFSVVVPKTADGNYDILITQEDLAGNTASTSLIWQKHVLSILPPSPQLVVNTPQVLTFNGGSGVYTVSITNNNSGGSYDSATKTYTPGILASVTDVLTLTDSLGASINYNVSTVAGAPDHLLLPASNGSGQSQVVGTTLAIPINAKVADRYGNPIAAYPLRFQVIRGDAEVLGSSIRSTNTLGEASVQLKLGYESTSNTVHIAPSSGLLPDLAGTGQAVLNVVGTGTTNGRGAFGSVFPAGLSPGAAVIDDFNGDGYKDVAVLNVGEPSIGIFLGRSSALFGTMSRVTPLCNGPNGLISADFNKDGRKDLAVACGGEDKVAIFLGLGTGSFSPRSFIPMDPVESIPVALAAADFNKDGELDLAVTAAGGALVGVRFGVGDGTFGIPTTYNVGQSPVSIAVSDIDKNSWPDLIVSNSGDNNIGLLLNNAAGGFNAQVSFPSGLSPSALAAADLDGDTYPDVVAVNNGEDSVSIFINDQANSFFTANTIPTGSSPTAVVIVDLNADSFFDLAVSNSGDGTVSTFISDGAGALNPSNSLNVVSNPVFITAGRINADGLDDLLILGNGNQEVQIIPGQPSGVPSWEVATGNSPTSSARGDFDEDGKMDVAVVAFSSNHVRIYKGDGQGLFSPMITLPTGNSPTHVVVGDLNGDGHSDLVVANQAGASVRVYLGAGDGTFQPFTDFPVGLQPKASLIRDFSSDGIADILVANSGSNNLSYLEGVGDGTFLPRVNMAVGNGPSGLVSSDFNSDGRPDVAVVNGTSDSVSILLGNGNGTFQSHVTYSTGMGPVSIVTGDFNRDGSEDVAVANSNEATVGILLGNGDGSLRTHIGYSCGNSPSHIVIGDFNADDKLDLAVSNGPAATLTVLLGTGNGLYNSSSSFATASSAASLSTGDFNGDGIIDFVVIQDNANTFQFWPGL